MINHFNFQDKIHVEFQIINLTEETFNVFDDASSSVFEDLLLKLQDNSNKSLELHHKLSNYVDDNDGIPTENDLELYGEIINLASDEYPLRQHLNSLAEMKIVYLFKSLEITMKSLIHIAYPKISTKDFYQWDNMASYFKSIDIKINEFNGYADVIELRKVNNGIKHNNIINEEINKIMEFKNEKEFNHNNLNNFYIRIKPKIQTFIKLLGKAIINELYVYSDKRIDKISNDFKLKMNSKILRKFANKLTNGKTPN